MSSVTYKGHKIVKSDKKDTFINGKSYNRFVISSGKYLSRFTPDWHCFYSISQVKAWIRECEAADK